MNDNLDMAFFQLVLSLQAGAMQYMGKVVSPVTGQIERNLMMARQTIDLLEMLSRKTQGNLNEDEKNLLDHMLYELRLNYLDEVEKDKAGGTAEQPPTPTVENEPDKADNDKQP